MHNADTPHRGGRRPKRGGRADFTLQFSSPALKHKFYFTRGNTFGDICYQYSCLENPVYRGAWWATVHGVAELDTTE